MVIDPVPGKVLCNAGELSWGGAASTTIWIDPAEELIAVFLAQAPDRRLHYRYLSRQLVYAAITGPAAR